MTMVIETPRLLLRAIVREDFDGWARLMSDPEAARFIGGEQPRSVAWRGFMATAGAWHVTGCSMLSVIEKQSGRWIGRVGPWQPEGWPGSEVGWGLLREFWGRGFAIEAASACVEWAFEQLDWTDVIHTIHPDNEASKRVAQKLGATNRGAGQLPPPLEDYCIDVWGQTRAQWRARRA